ncbi:MAG: peptidyl-alpha-hydroxyglycine alpha-amidating lyase family protein [Gemmatimonadota bacterium]
MRDRALSPFVLLAVLAGVVLTGAPLAAQLFESPANNHSNPYRTVNGYFELPDGRTWGATSAVHVDVDGTSIWVAERCGTNSCVGSDLDPVLLYDGDGNLVRSFGAGLMAWPHGIHVDRQGNVWIADAHTSGGEEEGKGHAVLKFSPEGDLLMTLGNPGVPGDGTGPTLYRPNDVITAPNGDIFVAEGHDGQGANADWDTPARIVKYDRNGNFIKSWGSLGTAPGQFRVPHGLAMDSRGRLFVADRGNVRIQIFDQDGNFIDEWKQFGRLSGIFIDENDLLYTADSESSPTSNPGWIRGIRIGSAISGHVVSFIPDPQMPDASESPGGTTAAEGVTADRDGNVYGAEVGPRQLVRYEPEE